MDFSKKWLKFLLHFFKKIKILRKIKIPNPTYLSSPNSLLLSILYQYTPFSQPKSSYGAKKSKNVKKRHFTPIFAPKVPHIMFFRKNVTRVFALSQKVSGGLAKFQRDLTYSFRELDFFCKKRIKGKCSFEPTGPLPLSLLNAKAGRGGHLEFFVAPLYHSFLTSRFRGGRSRGTLNALAKKSTLRVFFCSKVMWNDLEL